MTVLGLPHLKQTTTLPTAKQLSRKLERETRKTSRQQERQARQAARELARQAAREAKEAKRKGKQQQQQQQQTAPGEPLGVTAAAAAVQQGKERSWSKVTASGFMVREAGADLQEPKPFRPGQVKKIVNLYKDKSSSFLRVVSGAPRDGPGEAAVPGVAAAAKREARGRNKADAKGDGKGKKPVVGRCGGVGC